ncbi:MAG: hypothetical protein ABI353_01730 [Isosphaeraceae bacterium]
MNHAGFDSRTATAATNACRPLVSDTMRGPGSQFFDIHVTGPGSMPNPCPTPPAASAASAAPSRISAATAAAPTRPSRAERFLPVPARQRWNGPE